MKYLNPVWFYLQGPIFVGMMFFYMIAIIAAIVGVVESFNIMIGETTDNTWLRILICVISIYLGNITGFVIQTVGKNSPEQ